MTPNKMGFIRVVTNDNEVTYNAQTDNDCHMFHVTICPVPSDTKERLMTDLMVAVSKEMTRQGYNCTRIEEVTR